MLDEQPKRRKSSEEEVDLSKDKLMMLEIHKVEGDSGSTHVPVSINGKTWLIKRGERVKVPSSVVEVLSNAIKDLYVFDDATKSIIKREVPSYPFSATPV